jgi:hypothetical protein
MNKNHLAVAEAYYTAMAKKDINAMEPYLHSDVQFIGPLAKMKGKESVIESTRRILPLFKSLNIRAKSGTDDHVMLVYDLDFSTPTGILAVAVLLKFKNNLISTIELFYDGRPFDKRKDELFD